MTFKCCILLPALSPGQTDNPSMDPEAIKTNSMVKVSSLSTRVSLRATGKKRWGHYFQVGLLHTQNGFILSVKPLEHFAFIFPSCQVECQL